MRALSLAFASSVLTLLAWPARVEELGPAQAGQEARDGLRALMDKQRKDKAAVAAEPKPKPKPKPPKPQPNRKTDNSRKVSGSLGSKLPAVCIECGVK